MMTFKHIYFDLVDDNVQPVMSRFYFFVPACFIHLSYN